MPRKHHKPEEIVAKLRQVDVLTSQGKSVADAIRAIGVSRVVGYRLQLTKLARGDAGRLADATLAGRQACVEGSARTGAPVLPAHRPYPYRTLLRTPLIAALSFPVEARGLLVFTLGVVLVPQR